ncbi:hypothetical protein RhiLY_03050 [Ceratobasidium sp. AG-Ba]|nr:hypothetical protein RhiLY_03050 [Ceratobasidium sp. AG-Ba]
MIPLLLSLATGLTQVALVVAQPLTIVVSDPASFLNVLTGLSFLGVVSFANAVLVLCAVLQVFWNVPGLASTERILISIGKSFVTVFNFIVSLVGFFYWMKHVVTTARALMYSVLSVARLAGPLMWNEIVPVVCVYGRFCFYHTSLPLWLSRICGAYAGYERKRIECASWITEAVLESATTLGLALFGEWVLEDETDDRVQTRKAIRARVTRKRGKICMVRVDWAKRLRNSRREEQLSEYDDALEYLPGSREEFTLSSSPSQQIEPSLLNSLPIALPPTTSPTPLHQGNWDGPENLLEP